MWQSEDRFWAAGPPLSDQQFQILTRGLEIVRATVPARSKSAGATGKQELPEDDQATSAEAATDTALATSDFSIAPAVSDHLDLFV